MPNNSDLAELSACLLEEPTWNNPEPKMQAADTPLNDEFKITLFTATGIMTKTFGMQDGRLVKQRPGLIAKGKYQVISTTLKKMATGLENLTRKQALCLGTPALEKGNIVTKSEHKGTVDPIPRDKDHFLFRNQPTAMLFDFDGIKGGVKSALEVLSASLPGFDEAERLIVHSSSSGLYLGNKQLKNSNSAHVYVAVHNGTLIPDGMDHLFKRLWIAGHGHIEISHSGSLLTRTIIDASVGSPERIIYEAPPILKDGITQVRPGHEYIPGGMLDLALLPPLSDFEEKQYQDHVKATKANIKPEADITAAKYDKKQVERLIDSGVTQKQAQAAVTARRTGKLTLNDILHLSMSETVRVSDINKSYHGRTCCDPLEPSYNGWHDTVAKIFLNDDGSIVVNSNAHGGGIYRVEGSGAKKPITEKTSVADIMGNYEVKKEYVESLGREVWLYPDLVISGHILVIIAMTGGGKTTFLFYEVVPHMVKKGAEVYYIDADSPPSEHKAMKEFADDTGFKFINPDTRIGKSVGGCMKDMRKMVDAGVDLSGCIFIFDTLKKFTDLMSKGSVKEFFSLCRTMNTRGATCIFSAHANKYRDKDGHLIPEGVGDVKNDADDLILFERQGTVDGGINVTTVTDQDNGAKTRGIFKPFSFTITAERKILLSDKVIDLPDFTATRAVTATDEEILATAEKMLIEIGEPVNKTTLARFVYDLTEGAGAKRIRRVLSANSEKKTEGRYSSKRFVYVMRAKGAQEFELSSRKVQGDLS